MTADEALSAIRALCLEMAAQGRASYDIGCDIWAIAFRHVGLGESFPGLWMLWGSLTDWVEVEPTTEEQAEWRRRAGGPEQASRDAAREWLMAEQSDSGRTQYLDHWLYDVIGYERPGP